ncbi:MAG: hypothetical protein K8T90_06940 [Planctomycetes bacterium]|nr:hypothetical protein [Planctomycetota bacterium]
MRVVVDTGWTRPAMTPQARQRAQARSVGTVRGVGLMSGSDYELVRVEGMKSAIWIADGAVVAVVDDGIRRVVPDADMIIGAEAFLACGPVRVSVGRREIVLLPEWTPSGSDASVPLRLRSGVPWVSVYFGTQAVDLAIDTGSDATIAIPGDALATGSLSVEDRSMSAMTAGQSVRWSRGRLTVPVVLGDSVVDPGVVQVVEGPTTECSATQHIGRGLLRKFDVILDVSKGRAWFVRHSPVGSSRHRMERYQ